MNDKLKFFLLFFLLFFLNVLIFGCISKECENSLGYDVELSIDYSPSLDSFNLGDTLFISSIFSNELMDPDNGREVTLKDFSFFSVISYRVVREGNIVPVVFDDSLLVDMDVNYQRIDYSDNGIGIFIDKHNYDEDTGVYNLSFGLILNSIGTYDFFNYTELGESISTSQQRFEGQCSNETVYAHYKVNNGDPYENNFGLIEGKPPYENMQYFNFTDTGGYAFVVH